MLRLNNVSVISGSFNLNAINLEISTGSYAILMGCTGSGKTTLLETICGLRSINSGGIYLFDRDITDLPARERGIGYVPQDLALFNTMTVSENIGFALMIRRVAEKDIKQRVSELAGLLGISKLLERWPASLSGGEKQRVALGRALAMQPQILLLDEPFSALDDQTREDMYRLMRSVQQATHATVLHVTHSSREAEMLGNVQFYFDHGHIIKRKIETLAQ